MQQKLKVGVLLSGCGVYDGAEIQEAVFTLLCLNKLGVETICIAPNVMQHHVINHLNGQEMDENRNVLVEAARIARGDIRPLNEISISELDALAMPGGFGVAKNFTKWAFEGPDGTILEEVKIFIQHFHKAQKPIAAICMASTTLAKALENNAIDLHLTVGTTQAKSLYDIKTISEGMEKLGAIAEMKHVDEICIDYKNRIITSPCYMMEANIVEIYEGVEKTMKALVEICLTMNHQNKL